jgi:hypothetical protein
MCRAGTRCSPTVASDRVPSAAAPTPPALAGAARQTCPVGRPGQGLFRGLAGNSGLPSSSFPYDGSPDSPLHTPDLPLLSGERIGRPGPAVGASCFANPLWRHTGQAMCLRNVASASVSARSSEAPLVCLGRSPLSRPCDRPFCGSGRGEREEVLVPVCRSAGGV